MSLLLFLLGCAGSVPQKARPNILVVTLDTTRADHLGCYGHPDGATPTLDALAARGARFSRAYTVTPLTIPAHSSLFTGLYPPRHGVRDNGDFFLSDDADTLAEQLKAAGYATMASVGAEVTSHHWGFSQGFDAFYDDMGTPAGEARNRWRVERRGEAVVDDALSWLSANEAAGPWMAWVHLFDAHDPYEPPPPFDGYFPDPYLGELAYADAQVGRLLDHLRDSGEAEDTWVFVMADHGEGRGSHGEGLHGVLIYDATTRIPMIVRPPDALGGIEVGAPVSLVDVLPTVLDVAGVSVPAGLDGQSMLPLLSGEPVGDRDVYVESLYAYHHYGWAPQLGLVDADHKLIGSTTPELYSRFDRRELNNLAAGEPARLAAMSGRLDALTGEMEPTGAAGKAEMSPERLAQLEALGYITSAADVGEAAEGLPDPVDRLPLLRQAEQMRAALRDGELDTARSEAEAILAVEPNLHEVRSAYANILARQGEWTQAEEELLRLIELRPNTSGPLQALGEQMMRRRSLDRAVNLLQQAVDIDPYLVGAQMGLMHALYLQGQLASLDEALSSAQQKLPDVPDLKGIEGLLLAARRDPGAEAVLREALEARPRQPYLRTALADLLLIDGRTDEAETLLLDAIFNQPPALYARKRLVSVYAEQARYDEQIAQLDAVMAVSVDYLDLHSRAQAYFNLGKHAEALADIARCKAAAPAYPECVLLEANALNATGQPDAAKAALERANTLNEARNARNAQP